MAFAAARWFDNFNAIGDGKDTQWSQPERAQERSGQYDDEHYQAVAAVAQRAFKDGLLVRDTVAKRFHKSPYTVDKWLAECRKRGYLKSGELQRKKNPSQKGTQTR